MNFNPEKSFEKTGQEKDSDSSISLSSPYPKSGIEPNILIPLPRPSMEPPNISIDKYPAKTLSPLFANIPHNSLSSNDTFSLFNCTSHSSDGVLDSDSLMTNESVESRRHVRASSLSIVHSKPKVIHATLPSN